MPFDLSSGAGLPTVQFEPPMFGPAGPGDSD